jgi:hypothetical protein
VISAVDAMSIEDKREGLSLLKIKTAQCDSDETVSVKIRNMTESLFDGLDLIDPVASYDNWKQGPDYWVLRQQNHTDNNDGCHGQTCHGNTEQCDPHPPNNKCDITTSCIQTEPAGEYHCACR